MTQAVITVDDIAAIKPISDNIDSAKRIMPYVIEAQDLDVRPFLGEPLFYAFIEGVLASPQVEIYADLLNGKEYVKDENTIYFDGLKTVIAYFAYARFLKNQSTQVTRFGVTKKITDYSEPVTDEKIADLSGEARSNAMGYLAQVETFLDENDATYTLWGEEASKKPSGKIKISVVKNY